MEPEKKQEYVYWVCVYRMSDFHKVFSISCSNCKLKDRCASIYDKNDNCALAIDAEKVLSKIICANVSAFGHTDFYVNSNFKFSTVTNLLKQYRKYAHAR